MIKEESFKLNLIHISFLKSMFEVLLSKGLYINPLIPMSDQEIISPYIINAVSSIQVMRIKRKTQLGNYMLIQYQILQIKIISTCILWQIVRRIANEILGVKGLSGVFYQRTGTCIEQSSHHSPWVTA